MTAEPPKGYRALLRGRYSQRGAEYFITFCTENRVRGLDHDPVTPRILSEVRHMEADGVWVCRCAVVMPDHVHLLVQLGAALPLGKAVSRLKAKSATALNAIGLKWLAGYHEHRVRRFEDPFPLFLYIYLNPYRAHLLPTSVVWPWYVCGDRDRGWLLPMLNEGLPEPTWLANLP